MSIKIDGVVAAQAYDDAALVARVAALEAAQGLQIETIWTGAITNDATGEALITGKKFSDYAMVGISSTDVTHTITMWLPASEFIAGRKHAINASTSGSSRRWEVTYDTDTGFDVNRIDSGADTFERVYGLR